MATETQTYAASGSGSSVVMPEMPPNAANHVQTPPPLPRRVHFSPTQQKCLGLLDGRRIPDDTQMANTESSSKLGRQAVNPYSQMQLANPSVAIKKPVTRKRTYAAANASGSVAMAEVPPHGADHIQSPPPLPPGVYFSPSRDECLGFLNRWIAGDREMADARGYIFGANVYGESPDALAQRHPPASIRGRGEHAWWFLSETRFQSQTLGGGASKRADRRIEAGGFWRLEQGKEKLKKGKEKMEQGEEDEEETDGVKNCFGFYVGPRKKDDKTPWLMQEFTSANDNGAGKLGVPALYKVYVTPRATRDQQRSILGEHHVKKGLDGKKLPARAMVPQEYFDGTAELLPEGSVRGVAQEHIQAPPASSGLLGEFMAEAPSDNLSMPMGDFLRILDEQPVEMVEGGEPNWESLPDILDGDEFIKFN